MITHFECECHSTEHMVRFVVDPGHLPQKEDKYGWPPELYTEIQMIQWRPWYKRLWVAIKYLFGYRSTYGHWDCWILKDEDADKLQNVLTEYKIHRQNWERAQPKGKSSDAD